ncbi:MAG: hypothetical protein WA996_10170 [Candidatus Promineifilaceae bacterium]
MGQSTDIHQIDEAAHRAFSVFLSPEDFSYSRSKVGNSITYELLDGGGAVLGRLFIQENKDQPPSPRWNWLGDNLKLRDALSEMIKVEMERIPGTPDRTNHMGASDDWATESQTAEPDHFPKTNKARQIWVEIYYNVMQPLNELYAKAYLDDPDESPKPTLEDYQVSLFGHKSSLGRCKKTLGRIKNAGDAGLLEKYRP